MSPVFDCSSEGVRREGVTRAAEALRDGKLVVLPTDTVYGIGADAFNAEAVAALLAAKGRGRHMPPPVLIGDLAALDGLAIDVPDYARALAEAFWPGPLTLVLKAQPSLHWDLGDTNGTVALRMPDHELARDLLREVGPLAVSSANVSGWPASRTMVDAAAQLGAAVLVYLDDGATTGGLASTIVDCTTQTPAILRQGAVPNDDLTPYFPVVHVGTDPPADEADQADKADQADQAESADEATEETPDEGAAEVLADPPSDTPDDTPAVTPASPSERSTPDE